MNSSVIPHSLAVALQASSASLPASSRNGYLLSERSTARIISITLGSSGGVPDFHGLFALPSDSMTFTVSCASLTSTTSQMPPASCIRSPTSGSSWMEPTGFPSHMTSTSFLTLNTEQKSRLKTVLSPLGPMRSVPSSIWMSWSWLTMWPIRIL